MFASTKFLLAASGAASVALVGCTSKSEPAPAPKPAPEEPKVKSCKATADCDKNEQCENSICVPIKLGNCSKDSDCKTDEQCFEGLCVAKAPAVLGGECTKDTDCVGGAAGLQKCKFGLCVGGDDKKSDDSTEKL